MQHIRMNRLKNFVCLGLFALTIVQASGQTLFVSSCAEDTHVDAARKKAIDLAAMNFIETLLGANPSSAFDLFSRIGKENTNRQQLDGFAAAMIRPFDPRNIGLMHTYLIEVKGDPPERVVCGRDIAKPDGWESFAVANVPQQAYALVSADTLNNKWAFTVWLVPEQSEWRVQSFSLNVSTLADKDSMQLWTLARGQQSKGHSFNAALLYFAAKQTADRGPNLQLGITQTLSEEMSKLALPSEIQGDPPFSWKAGEITYTVKSVGPIAVGGKIYIVINHEVPPWDTDSQVDGWNRQLLLYFKKRFPEYSDSFAGLVARATERGTNRGYGTVEENLPAN